LLRAFSSKGDLDSNRGGLKSNFKEREDEKA
jgi:hypothetical protein